MCMSHTALLPNGQERLKLWTICEICAQMQPHKTCYHNLLLRPLPSLPTSSSLSLLCKERIRVKWDQNEKKNVLALERSLDLCLRVRGKRREVGVAASSSSNVAEPVWDGWLPEKGSKAPSLSDVVWPSAGAFAAMAILGKMDQMLAPKGISMTIASLGSVCAVLFATPSSPAARKYNMFMAHIGCAALGVLAFSIFGPGWLARSTGLSAAIAYMIWTRAIHPPAASLPVLFIDGVKLHRLNFWYALFPGAAACLILCLIQEVVCYLKENFKF